MLAGIELKNFRNFSEIHFSFEAGKNIIIGQNGKGKTNILEAISLPSHALIESESEYFIRQGEKNTFVRYHLEGKTLAYAQERDGKRKKYFLENKSTTKARLSEVYPHIISFHPQSMNLLYGPPSERRTFLDTTLMQAFPAYKKIHSQYQKILSSRNAILRSIAEGKSEPSECDFWDQIFLSSAREVYSYRKKIVEYYQSYTPKLAGYFFGKITDMSFHYQSRIDLDAIETSLENILREKKQKELLLKKTCVGPHLDDFEIYTDGVSLIHFASRGEVKSILLGLKFGESNFIEYHSSKEEMIYIIDDFLSELDETHLSTLYRHIGNRQCIITAIEDPGLAGHKIYL